MDRKSIVFNELTPEIRKQFSWAIDYVVENADKYYNGELNENEERYWRSERDHLISKQIITNEDEPLSREEVIDNINCWWGFRSAEELLDALMLVKWFGDDVEEDLNRYHAFCEKYTEFALDDFLNNGCDGLDFYDTMFNIDAAVKENGYRVLTEAEAEQYGEDVKHICDIDNDTAVYYNNDWKI